MSKDIQQTTIDVSPLKRVSVTVETDRSPEALACNMQLVELATLEDRHISQERANALASELGGFLNGTLTRREVMALTRYLKRCVEQY